MGDHSYRGWSRRRLVLRRTAGVALGMVLFVVGVVGSLALRLHSDTSSWLQAVGFALLGVAGLIVVLGLVFLAGIGSRRRARALDQSSPEASVDVPPRKRSLLPPGRLTARVIAAVPLTMAPLFLLDPNSPHRPGAVPDSLGDRVFGATVLGLITVFMVTITRPTMQLFPWGVRIRNPIRTLDLPWSDIRAVEATDGGALTVTSVTFGPIPVWVYQESPIGFLLGGYSAKRARNMILGTIRAARPGGTAACVPHSRRDLPLLVPFLYWLMTVALIYRL